MTRVVSAVVMLGLFLPAAAGAQDEPPDAYPAPPEAVPAPPTQPPAQQPPPPGYQPGYQPAYPPPPIQMRPSNRVTRNVAVYGELLGKGLIYGLGFDYNFTRWIGIGGVFSYYKIDDFQAGVASPYLALYAGGFSSAFVAHIGPTFLFASSGDLFLMFDDQTVIIGQASIGYEYRSGFLFRVMATMFFDKDDFLPGWPGFTFGGAF